MKTLNMFAAAAAFSCLVSAAQAQPPGVGAYRSEATLATPAGAVRTDVIAGVSWRCDGGECVGEAPGRTNVDGLVKACKRVVAVYGPVARYAVQGRALDVGQLRACNRAAPVQTAQN